MDKIITWSLIPTPLSWAIDDYFQDTDVHMCLTMLKIEFWTKVLELGIKDSTTRMRDIFSDEDGENWSQTERSWVNIIRCSRWNINYLLNKREELLRKDMSDITPEDEREYDDLGRKLDIEVFTAKQLIEDDMERILSAIKNHAS